MKNICGDGGISYGQQLNVLAVSLANAVAEGRTANELEYLSAFLQLTGEALSMIAAVQTICSGNSDDNPAVK